MIAGFFLLAVKLAVLQFCQGKWLSNMAAEQQLLDTKIPAKRGTIYDRDMNPLALSATVWKVVLEPSYIRDDSKREIIANGLSEILGMDKEKILELSKKRTCYTVVKNKIESDIKDKIIEFKTQNNIAGGVRLIEDYKRYYPKKNFASVVLGFVGNELQGLAGVEAFYEKSLKGQPGRLVTAKNARGTEMPFDYEELIPAKNGANLRLCIDETVQHVLEKNLEEGIINNKVKNRAFAIAMDVKNGDILGMAVKGDFDPNEPFKISDEASLKIVEEAPEEERSKLKREFLNRQWRNKAVNDCYYPGSVFKLFVASMGIELGLIKESDPYFCSGSIVPYEGAGRAIRCHKRSGHGAQTFKDVLCHSCNPGFISLGMKIGAENFFRFYKNFGFHEKTKIDLPGESTDLFFSADGKMAPMDLATASIGQNFSVTPLQMIRGIAAIANGGYLVTPHVVKEILDDDGNVIQKIEYKPERCMCSKDTLARVVKLAQENVISGAGKNAYVPGCRVAGKTGTSQKIGLCETPGVMDYISSFCGFAPADDPKIIILVAFDTPKGPYYYGSAVACPAFANSLPEIFSHLKIEKIYTEEESKKLDCVAPNLIDKKVGEAKNILNQENLVPIIYGKGEKILSQIPEPFAKIPKNGKMILYTESEKSDLTVKVPNLVHLNVTNAVLEASKFNLNLKIIGENLSDESVQVGSQSIPAGTEVKSGSVITVNVIKNISD